jgi:bidirectional [NiFe] hydrogenase diaphorase subunit
MSQQRRRRRSQEPHPSGDDRYKAIDLAARQYGFEKDALLEILNIAQLTFGYLSEELLLYISNSLKIPLSQIYGVATFYHLFTFEPLGKHNCTVCTGTACYVKGAADIVDDLGKKYDLEGGGTTPDGFFSLVTARCLGSCGLAPVVVLDGKVMGRETSESMLQKVHTIYSEDETEKGAE